MKSQKMEFLRARRDSLANPVTRSSAEFERPAGKRIHHALQKDLFWLGNNHPPFRRAPTHIHCPTSPTTAPQQHGEAKGYPSCLQGPGCQVQVQSRDRQGVQDLYAHGKGKVGWCTRQLLLFLVDTLICPRSKALTRMPGCQTSRAMWRSVQRNRRRSVSAASPLQRSSA